MNKEKQNQNNHNYRNKSYEDIVESRVIPAGRFGISRRKAQKSLELAYENGAHFSEEEGFGPITKAVFAPSAELKLSLESVVNNVPNYFNLPQDKELKKEYDNAKDQLAADLLMTNIAERLGDYTSNEESGSVVFSLEESSQIDARDPMVGIPRHWQGDLRSGLNDIKSQVEVKWSLGGQIVSLGYSKKDLFVADGSNGASDSYNQKFQTIVDYSKDVVLFGAIKHDSASGEVQSDGGSMSVFLINSVLENPDTKIIKLDKGE